MAESQSPPEAKDESNPDEPSVALLFAEDLMRYIMTKNELIWESSAAAHRFRETVSTAFVPEIGQAVSSLTEQQKSIIEQQYIHYQNSNFQSGGDFKFAARGIALRCFSKGFNADAFLKYCAKITALAVMFFKDNITEVPDVAINSIEEILTRHFSEEFDFEGQWESLYEECSNILGCQVMGER